MKTIKALAILLLTLGLTAPAFAQTVVTSTTTTAAITATGGTAGQYIPLTSTTGVTAPGTGSATVYLLIDREFMLVKEVNTTSLVAKVVRGANHSRTATHISGATVWVANPQAIVASIPSGSCTRTNLLYVPVIVGGSAGLGSDEGSLWDCLGGNFYQTNAPNVGVQGASMASTAGTLGLPTGLVFAVSGTNAITGFTVPAGLSAGMCLTLIPGGTFTTTTAGNISLASTAVAHKVLFECWDGSKFNPSY